MPGTKECRECRRRRGTPIRPGSRGDYEGSEVNDERWSDGIQQLQSRASRLVAAAAWFWFWGKPLHNGGPAMQCTTAMRWQNRRAVRFTSNRSRPHPHRLRDSLPRGRINVVDGPAEVGPCGRSGMSDAVLRTFLPYIHSLTIYYNTKQ